MVIIIRVAITLYVVYGVYQNSPEVQLSRLTT